MPRYSEFEQAQIEAVRDKINQRISESPQYPDVVGDRKILRFLRGLSYDVDVVCQKFVKYLDWRKEHKVDDIRQNILLGGLDCPSKFPFSQIMLKYQPQAVICPEARDKHGSPICVEKFNFSPSEIMQHISTDEFIVFYIYTLEYKSLILEQLSDEHDQEYLNSLSEEHKAIALGDKDSDIVPAYGAITGLCVIRDLEGLGFEHIGSLGQEILNKVIKLSSDNYPDSLHTCYVINSPWIFQTIWWFIHGLLSARTVAKITVIGSNYDELLRNAMNPDNIPNLIGGPYSVEHSNVTPFVFSLSYFYPDLSEEERMTLSQQLLESNAEILAQQANSNADPADAKVNTAGAAVEEETKSSEVI